jgi:branched-chain amino acid transport system substrate-binding protein
VRSLILEAKGEIEMPRTRFFHSLVLASAVLWSGATAGQQASDPIRIGVIDDMSGMVEALGGKGSLLAATMAVEDFGGKVLGRPLQIVSADHQNRPDVGGSVAAEWFDRGGVEAIVSGGVSSVTLAIQQLAKARPNKVLLVGGSQATDISGKSCTANTVQFAANNYSLAAPVTKVLTAQGLNTWFIMVVDYTAGHAAQAAATAMVEAAGGKVIGSARFPVDATEFSAFILQAQAAKPKVLAIGVGGDQGQNIVRQAAEFGLQSSGITIAPLVMYITDIHAMGAQVAQGLRLSTAFYWDRNEQTRAWSKRFFDKHGKMPTQNQASAYAAVTHYLQSVHASGSTDGTKVVPKMKASEVQNAVYQGGFIREDGSYVRPIYVVEVKSAQEQKYAWDYYKIIREVPANEAFMSLAEQGCPNPTK